MKACGWYSAQEHAAQASRILVRARRPADPDIELMLAWTGLWPLFGWSLVYWSVGSPFWSIGQLNRLPVRWSLELPFCQAGVWAGSVGQLDGLHVSWLEHTPDAHLLTLVVRVEWRCRPTGYLFCMCVCARVCAYVRTPAHPSAIVAFQPHAASALASMQGSCGQWAAQHPPGCLADWTLLGHTCN